VLRDEGERVLARGREQREASWYRCWWKFGHRLDCGAEAPGQL